MKAKKKTAKKKATVRERIPVPVISIAQLEMENGSFDVRVLSTFGPTTSVVKRRIMSKGDTITVAVPIGAVVG